LRFGERPSVCGRATKHENPFGIGWSDSLKHLIVKELRPRTPGSKSFTIWQKKWMMQYETLVGVGRWTFEANAPKSHFKGDQNERDG
jgi:hypothetical protein